MWQQEDRGRMSLPFISPRLCDLEVSFEFFPPKTAKAEESLWESVTYGAAGTTRIRTHEVVTGIHKKTGLSAAAHLTCIGASRGEIDDIARTYWDAGIRHIVALRGDPPQGTTYAPAEGGYQFASDLVAGLKKIAPFEISVAGYPETHPEALNARTDMAFLKKKVDAGADRIISQFFMEPDVFLNFRDRAVAAGINIPIVPGILSITNFNKTVEFAKKCGARVPDWMDTLFEGLDDQPKTRQLVAATVAAEQCRVLYANGIRDFHFYTLNRAEHTLAICHMLGMRSAAGGAKAALRGEG
jgi:methylenetetrahydrofolate reductase (NADPH)